MNVPTLEPEAMYGLAGEYVRAVQPYTEASAPGLLVATLVSFGNAINRNAFVRVGGTTHYPNEFVLLVGPTATSRKGDTMKLAVRPVENANPAWGDCLLGGFGSGEAVVEAVRDRQMDPDDAEKVLDAGATDKRLLVYEEELAHVIAVAARDGSTLSSLWRKAWDGQRLENRTKGRRLIATGAHVSALAAITPDELVRKMPATEFANGFMNRFLIVAVQRTHQLPDPPTITAAFDREWSERFRAVLDRFPKHGGEMKRVGAAKHLWRTAYCDELSVERPDLAGAVCSRAEAHVLRLSMLYALLDGTLSIALDHVQAALALWHYCERSAYLIFGDRLGDPTADTILDALRERESLTRSQVHDLFGRHRPVSDIERALSQLARLGLVRSEEEQTGGRPLTTYYRCETSGESEERVGASGAS